MASTAEIKNGLCMKFNHDVYTVVEFLHVKPGKGPAFVRTKLKSLTNGKVVDQTFPSGHKIDDIRVERRKFQYLYKDEMGLNLMENETYEQISIAEKIVDNAKFLKEGCEVEVLFAVEDNRPLTVDLPQHMSYLITYTEPGVKGDTATNVTKPATLEGGAEIRVPIFINEGDTIKVDTRTGAYLERIKV